MEWILDILLLLLKPIIGSAKELLQELRMVRKNLQFYARQISNPGAMEKAEIEQASCALRQNATKLNDLTGEVKCFSFLAFMHVVPEKDSVLRASELLGGLSNGLGYIEYNGGNLNDGMRNGEKVDEIKKLLLIKADFCERFSGWIVFVLVALGGYTLLEFIVKIAQKILGVH